MRSPASASTPSMPRCSGPRRCEQGARLVEFQPAALRLLGLQPLRGERGTGCAGSSSASTASSRIIAAIATTLSMLRFDRPRPGRRPRLRGSACCQRVIAAVRAPTASACLRSKPPSVAFLIGARSASLVPGAANRCHGRRRRRCRPLASRLRPPPALCARQHPAGAAGSLLLAGLEIGAGTVAGGHRELV